MDKLRYKDKRLIRDKRRIGNRDRMIESVNNRSKGETKKAIRTESSSVSKKNTRQKHSMRIKKNMRLIYKAWIAISFIIIQFIQPIWGEKEMVKIFKGMLKVCVSSAGVIQIDVNRYITRKNGWEQLDKLLKDKGYKTHVLFRQCEFWVNDEIKKKLKGRNIGEFFILWEGDEI